MYASLNRRVSGDLQELETLHNLYDWIPGPNQIRPSEEIKAVKRQKLIEIQNEWESFCDYILHSVFQKSFYVRSNGLKRACDKNTVNHNCVEFLKNEFPYQVSPESNHYVLWFGTPHKMVDDDTINHIISLKLGEIVGKNSFVFVWYENPKVTIPEFYHIQVFWKKLA